MIWMTYKLNAYYGHDKRTVISQSQFQVSQCLSKITQRNTNRTASHKSIFKIYILYEGILSLFPLPRLCLVCMPQMIISLCIK